VIEGFDGLFWQTLNMSFSFKNGMTEFDEILLTWFIEDEHWSEN